MTAMTICLVCVYFIVVENPSEDERDEDEFAAPRNGSVTLGCCLVLIALPLHAFSLVIVKILH